MKIETVSAVRKISALLIAVAAYYIIHEGAHLIFAAALGKFEKIRLLFGGVQVVADTQSMTTLQVGLFCLAGAAATLTAAYLLCLSVKLTVKIKSDFARAVLYYITLAFLLTDPIYLSVLCGFFGGGDMNGIALLLNETAARLIFGGLAAINITIFFIYILPEYRAAFQNKSSCKDKASGGVSGP